MPNIGLTKTGIFKALTGGDEVNAQRKYGQPFDFVNSAKLIFSCNEIPPNYYDDTIAFWRRWIIFDFPNTFLDEKADSHMLEKITMEDELDGLVYPVLEGLRRLMNKGKFSNDMSWERTRQDYMNRSDPIGGFKEECIEEDPPSVIVSKKEVYNAYMELLKTSCSCRLR